MFITPNITNDGHDTNVTFASAWKKIFLTPLLNNSYFMNGTLLLLTFDEAETYTQLNKVFSIFIGGPDVIPVMIFNNYLSIRVSVTYVRFLHHREVHSPYM